MREEVTLSIGDVENVIQILGEVYRDPRDALAEFIIKTHKGIRPTLMTDVADHGLSL